MTPEQVKRKQLADAIFGDVKPKVPQQEQVAIVKLFLYYNDEISPFLSQSVNLKIK